MLAGLAIAAPASADEAPPEATVLFTKGRELVKAGNHAEACPLFERSLRLAPAVGTELNLGRCYAATGKLAAARKIFERLVKAIDAADDPQRAQLAQQGLDEVNGRVPKLRIELGMGMPRDARVELDGEAASTEKDLPVDPGPHTVSARAARSVIYTAREGALATITLDLAERPVRRPIVWGLGAAAAGSLAVGALVGVGTFSVRDAGRKRCDTVDGELLCDQRGLDLLGRARTLSHVSTTLLVAGVGLGVAAVVLELRHRREKLPPIVIEPRGDGATVGYGGAW
ncbi:MAG: tetratricopeptide repeat protein [Deltaproteobacteria bacterium]|nr:tetratricopeptide repeat protein [Deltaproteobacteria bacterium]